MNTDRKLTKESYDKLTDSKSTWASVHSNVEHGYGHINATVRVPISEWGFDTLMFDLRCQVGHGVSSSSDDLFMVKNALKRGEYAYAFSVKVDTHRCGGMNSDMLKMAAKLLAKAEKALEKISTDSAGYSQPVSMGETFVAYMKALGGDAVLVDPVTGERGMTGLTHHTQRDHYALWRDVDRSALEAVIVNKIADLWERVTPESVRERARAELENESAQEA